MERLIEYTENLPPDAIGTLSAQDIGMCLTWYDSQESQPAVQEKSAQIPRLAADWSTLRSRPESLTEGRRNQWVLRDLIDELRNEDLLRLGWAECTFLLRVYGLCSHAANPDAYARIIELIQPSIPRLQSAVKGKKSRPGAPSLSRRVLIITAADIEQARQRDIKVFAGIEMPSLGHVLTSGRHVKVLDNVPENCILVVEQGSCSVEGFVMGRIAAQQHCDVRENIAGVVVVRQGNIRARNIINNAYVVSKAGSVQCRQAQDPALVFGGTELCIQENAILGTYFSPRISITGEARGGTYHVSRRATAGLFRNTPSSALGIVLRRDLSGADYGERLEKDAIWMERHGRSLRRRIARLRAMAHQAQNEIESMASNALYYLCTGGDMHKHIEGIDISQRRLSTLRRLIEGFQTLVDTVEDDFGGPEAEPDKDRSGSDDASYAELDTELQSLVSEGQVDRDLSDAMEEIGRIRERLSHPRSDDRATSQLLVRLRSRLGAYQQQVRLLSKQIENSETKLKDLIGSLPLMKAGASAPSAQQLLRRVAATARSKAPDDLLARKVQSPFMEMMLRRIDNRGQQLKQYQAKLHDLQQDFTRTAERLGEEFHITISAHEPIEREMPFVSGQFEDGVRICTDPFLLTIADPPKDSLLATRDSRGRTDTFLRTLAGDIVRFDEAGADAAQSPKTEQGNPSTDA